MSHTRVDDISSEIHAIRQIGRGIDDALHAFGARVVHASDRLAELQARAVQHEGDALVGALLEELRVQSEMLHAASHALRRQNQEFARARATLEAERRRYFELFESVPDSLVTTDVHGVIVEANLAAGQLFNLDSRHVVGKPLINFVARQDTRAFRCVVRDHPAERVQPLEFRLRPRHKGVFHALLTVTASSGIGRVRPALRWVIRLKPAALVE